MAPGNILGGPNKTGVHTWSGCNLSLGKQQPKLFGIFTPGLMKNLERSDIPPLPVVACPLRPHPTPSHNHSVSSVPLGMQAWDLWDLPGPDRKASGTTQAGSPDEGLGRHAVTLGGHLPKPQGLGSEANAPASCIWPMLSAQKETGFNPGYRPLIELVVKSWRVDRQSQGMYKARFQRLPSGVNWLGWEGRGFGIRVGPWVLGEVVSSPSLRLLNSPKLVSLRSGGSEGRQACPPPGELTIWRVQQASKARSEGVCEGVSCIQT